MARWRADLSKTVVSLTPNWCENKGDLLNKSRSNSGARSPGRRNEAGKLKQVKKIVILLLAVLAIAGPSLARTKRKSTRPAAHSSKRVTRSKTYVRRSSARSNRKSTKVRTSAHSTQQGQPAPERYKEIQQSLAEKGYYKGDVNGQWGAESTSALKRFQSEQNLASDGKLNSLSLIALGLGPKRSLTASAGNRP